MSRLFPVDLLFPQFFRRTYKGREYFSAAFFRAVRKFRMPLDRPDKSAVRHIYSFRQSIFRHRHDFQPRRQLSDRLVMVAVDCQAAAAQQIIKGCSFLDLHFMYRHIIRRLLAMRHPGSPLGRQILLQGPAQDRIQELYASADSQNRYVFVQHFFQKHLFHPVPFQTALPALWQTFFSI